jgi:hypothetical protein
MCVQIGSHLAKLEVMPMIESSKRMGHQIGNYRLCAGAAH